MWTNWNISDPCVFLRGLTVTVSGGTCYHRYSIVYTWEQLQQVFCSGFLVSSAPSKLKQTDLPDSLSKGPVSLVSLLPLPLNSSYMELHTLLSTVSHLPN